MPQTTRPSRSALLLASLWLGSGMLASPALAGGHKHVSKYDVVQGYIIQPQAQATVPVSLVNTSNQPTPAASSQIGSTLNLAPSSPQMPAPSPVTLQLAPAAPQIQTLQLAPTALQVQTLQLAPAVPVQTLQLAPAMTQVQTLQLAPAPVQQVTLQLQAPTLSIAPQQVCASQVQVATPAQLLIPHHNFCHLFGW